jgi:hypothetical protein
MRHYVRMIKYAGPENKKTFNPEWQTGGVAGIKLNDLMMILNFARFYQIAKGHDTTVINDLIRQCGRGPICNFNPMVPALYQGRDDTVSLLLEGFWEWSIIETHASLYLYDLSDERATLDGLSKDEYHDIEDLLSGEEYYIYNLLQRFKKDRDLDNRIKYDISSVPTHKLKPYMVAQRKAKIAKDRDFRIMLDEM